MKKRIFSLFCVLAVVLVFALTAQTVSLSWNVGAEESSSVTTKKQSQETPYEDPETSATTATQEALPFCYCCHHGQTFECGTCHEIKK